MISSTFLILWDSRESSKLIFIWKSESSKKNIFPADKQELIFRKMENFFEIWHLSSSSVFINLKGHEVCWKSSQIISQKDFSVHFFNWSLICGKKYFVNFSNLINTIWFFLLWKNFWAKYRQDCMVKNSVRIHKFCLFWVQRKKSFYSPWLN